MASTRLGRKARRNKATAKNRISKIKLLNTVPTIKNVDVEEIKKEFDKGGSSAKKSTKKEAPAKEEAKKETKASKKEEAPKPEEKKADKEATDKEEK